MLEKDPELVDLLNQFIEFSLHYSSDINSYSRIFTETSNMDLFTFTTKEKVIKKFI